MKIYDSMPILETRKLEKLLRAMPRPKKTPKIIGEEEEEEEEKLEEQRDDFQNMYAGVKSGDSSKKYYSFNETYALFESADRELINNIAYSSKDRKKLVINRKVIFYIYCIFKAEILI
jgi:hypothetical protein